MFFYAIALSLDSLIYSKGVRKYQDPLAKNINTKNTHIWIRIAVLLLWSRVFGIDPFVFIDFNGSAYRCPQAYRNANLSMAEIGRKIGFSKSAISKFLSFYSGWMSASGDFAVPMSFPRHSYPKWEYKIKNVLVNRSMVLSHKWSPKSKMLC